MGPVAMLRPPPGTSSQTQPDGRPAYSVFPFRLGQRGIAPLCARALSAPASGRARRAARPPRRRPSAAPGRPVDTPALDVFVDVLQNSSDVFRHRLLPLSSQSRSAAQR